ncbi:MAG TPA: hypothetical protein VIL74_16865 [Pyrinomonadaceae bacterium]|jgi:hypothetical protein
MFENFDVESNETVRRRRASIGWIFLGLVVYLIAVLVYFSFYFNAENKKRLVDANRIERADDLCRNLRAKLAPSQNGVRRGEPVIDERSATVVYRYHSALKLEEVKRHQYLPTAGIRFIDWLDEMGWEPTGENGFAYHKGNQTFSLREMEDDGGNYELRCTETEISFGIY